MVGEHIGNTVIGESFVIILTFKYLSFISNILEMNNSSGLNIFAFLNNFEGLL